MHWPPTELATEKIIRLGLPLKFWDEPNPLGCSTHSNCQQGHCPPQSVWTPPPSAHPPVFLQFPETFFFCCRKGTDYFLSRVCRWKRLAKRLIWVMMPSALLSLLALKTQRRRNTLVDSIRLNSKGYTDPIWHHNPPLATQHSWTTPIPNGIITLSRQLNLAELIHHSNMVPAPIVLSAAPCSKY